ncbi:MAG: MFS transporter [Candidatus Hydrothermarchaeota archaeon]
MRANFKGIDINIILLGIVSFLTDASTEMILPVLPMFITTLGGSGLIIGLIGGLGDSIASVLKVFSGYWSDRLGRRKIFVFSGYATSSISKLILPFSKTWHYVLILIPLERVGKGLRTAPRDAIIADSVSSEVIGKSFGIHRAMDTSGAILGSILAFVLIYFLNLDIRNILLIAGIVALTALFPIHLVREEVKKKEHIKITLNGFSRSFWLFIIVASIFALGNFTYMFFILRAQDFFTGDYAVSMPVLLYVLYNIFYSAFSIPSGILSDKFGRKNVILIGYSLFAFTCLGFAFLGSLTLLIVFFAFYGLSYAFIDGQQRAFVVDLSPEKLRGTALGIFHTVSGIATFPSSLIAGFIWQFINPEITFLYGFIVVSTSILLFIVADIKYFE